MITNPGSVYSEPILTVYGSGNITLMVGTTIVELENISGSIIFNCALQEAYLGSALMNDHRRGLHDQHTVPDQYEAVHRRSSLREDIKNDPRGALKTPRGFVRILHFHLPKLKTTIWLPT